MPARIRALVRMGLLHQTGNDQVEVLEVVRLALLGRVAPLDVREAHLSLARFYGRSHRPEAIRERFLHLAAGEDSVAALHLLEEQQQVILRLGYSEALRRTFRKLATALPPGPARGRLLMAEAALLRHHSEHAEAIATLRQAIAGAGKNVAVAVEGSLSIVEQQLKLGRVDAAVAEFASAEAIGFSSRRLVVYSRLTQARILEAKGDTRHAFNLYQEAFDLSKKARANDLGLEAIAAWSRLAEITQGPKIALRIVEDALPRARAANRIDVVFNLLLVRSRAYVEINRSDLAELEMRAIRSEAESLGYLNQLAYTLSGLAAVAAQRSSWAEAAALGRQASSMAERLGNDLVLGHTLAVLCASELRQSVLPGLESLANDALEHGLRSVELLSRLTPSESLMLAHGYLVEGYLLKGNRLEARKHYDQALALGDQLNIGYTKDAIRAEFEAKLAEA